MVIWLVLLAAGMVQSKSIPCSRPYEIYKPSGSAPSCEATCDDSIALCLPQSQLKSFACVCTEGYVRDFSGHCTAKDTCPSMCTDPNEVWHPTCNTPKCEQSSLNWGQPCDGRSHVRCSHGKDGQGKCEEENCRYSCVGTWKSLFLKIPASGKECEFSCTPDGRLKCDENYSNKSGCHCAVGYVRAVDGSCMKISDCDSNNINWT